MELYKTTVSTCVLLISGAAVLEGQAGMGGMGGMTGGPVQMAPNQAGFGFYSASAFGGYATDPQQLGTRSSKGLSMTGAMASMGYSKVLGERSRFSILYSPGVIVRPTDLSRSRANHLLSINLKQGITARLNIGVSIYATYAELDQFAFSPARYSLVTAPGSFDDLANAIAGGQYSNSQIASLLTGTPVLESEARSSIYGNQALTVNGQFRLNYQMSPRLTIGFNAGVNRYQNVGTKGDDLDRRALIPITNGVTSGVNVSYSFNPRTSIGGTVTMTRTSRGRLFESTYVTYMGNVSQRVGQKVVVTGQAGSGNIVDQSRQGAIGGLPINNKRYLAGVSLAVQATNSQRFMVQGMRTFVDSYGLGTNQTMTYTASWGYSPVTSQWSGSILAGYLQSSISRGRDLNGLFGAAGVNRKVGQNWGISCQVYYSRTDNTLGTDITGAQSQGTFDRIGARLLVTWFPRPVEY